MALKFVLTAVLLGQITHQLELKNKAYENLVVSISDDVPVENCKEILENLEDTISTASSYLFSALHAHAYIRSSTVILPSSWPDNCAPKQVVPSSGEKSDITVLPGDSSRGKMWTQQSGGCGKPGDQIYLGYKALEGVDSNLGHAMVKEFAMYRYGVFEEQGYKNDPIYPMCFYDKEDKVQINGCSDFPIIDNGICDGSSTSYNISEMVDQKARTSIMFAAESPSVSMFCDSGNHDSYAPTKHNLICARRNTYDVILQHPDFHSRESSSDLSETNIELSARITYKRHTTTRYVFVIENTKNMAVRESWTFLRSAIRKWVQFDLPENSEVGLVLTNETNAYVASSLRSLKDTDKNIIASALPYFTADTSQTPCLNCAISVALEMFRNVTSPGSNVIIVIAPGINNGSQTLNILKKAKEDKVRIASISYPNVLRQSNLDFLAEYTNGVAYSVIEKKQNVEHSMISTYFQLSNALYNIIETFYAGNLNDIPMEIHRREVRSDRSSITGSFFLDENIGGPIKFMLYTHNQNPLIRSITLTSPNQQDFKQRIDNLEVKIISIQPTTSQNGTWTYTIEPVAGNPQPHFLQVMAKPLSKTSNVIRSRFWISKDQGPTVLYVEVKKGNNPIISAKVEVTITKTEANGSSWHKETLQLFDTGSGDPDVTMSDGIYTRYHNAYVSGPGTYTYEVIVNDNGNTAYYYEEYPYNGKDDEACCGSTISPSKKRIPVKPFERVLSPVSIDLTSEEINTANRQPSGRILDLRAEVRPEELKAILTWTAPDMGGHSVESYEIKYADNMEDIADNLELKAKTWGMGDPLPLSIGSETNFNLDFSRQRAFLDKTVYFAVKATSKISMISTVSNFVRVHVKSPPPPPTVPPTYSTYDHSAWPGDGYNVVDTRPNMINDSGFGNEIIYGVVAVVIALIIILAIYYCMCVKKKTQTAKSEALKSDKMTVAIPIDPNTPLNQPNPQNCYSNHQISDNDHTIGVPINYNYDDEPKKRYSLVQQQEQQLIEELKHQHMNQNYSGLSVISNGSLQRNQPTLSPYNSWSASQLLHEHERRHSPLTDEQMMTHEEIIEHLDHMSLNGHVNGHMNGHVNDHLNGQNVDHVSLNSHQMNGNHYGTNGHIPPPVPPLPAYGNGGYPVNYIYGVQNQPIYQTRGEPFNQSLQGSMSSVNGGEKKRRNVTMV